MRAELTSGPLFRPRQHPRTDTLASRAMNPVTMWRTMETYLCQLPGATHAMWRAHGSEARVGRDTPHSLRSTTATLRLYAAQCGGRYHEGAGALGAPTCDDHPDLRHAATLARGKRVTCCAALTAGIGAPIRSQETTSAASELVSAAKTSSGELLRTGNLGRTPGRGSSRQFAARSAVSAPL